MIKNKITLLFSVITLMSLQLCALDIKKEADDKSKTYNEVDDIYLNESGFAYYEDSNNSKKVKKKDKEIVEKIEKNLLYKILLEERKQTKEDQEQTKLLTEIRDILQEAHNPKAKKIVVNGKECIANSSAECFSMPLTPDAKRVPVLGKWISNPSLETASEYIKWQQKYFNSINKGAYALNIAGKSLPSNAGETKGELSTPTGRDKSYKDTRKENIIASHSKDMKAYIMLGKTPGLDFDYTLRTLEMWKNLKTIGVQTYLIFKDNQYLTSYSVFSKNSHNTKVNKIWDEIQQSNKAIVSQKLFSEVSPHSTPYAFVNFKDHEGKEFSNVFAIGRENYTNSIENLYRVMIINDVIEPNAVGGEQIYSQRLKELEGKITDRNSTQSKQLIDTLIKLQKD